MTKIEVNNKGQKVVVIDEIVFKCKRRIDWHGVEQFLKQYVGKQYRLDELDEMIYIGTDFPDEYANSKYSHKIYGTIGKAKANVSQAIPELIEIATNIVYQVNANDKHINNARYGWYRCTIRFSLPKCDDKGNIVGNNNFQGRMIIRHDNDGKKYLYDIVDIKKET